MISERGTKYFCFHSNGLRGTRFTILPETTKTSDKIYEKMAPKALDFRQLRTMIIEREKREYMSIQTHEHKYL